jgi:VIT1/CCC1 family predicted Fe2+/Mn2+ transporter
VSVSSPRDSERAALVLERRELAESPQAEVAELARIAVTIIAVLAALVATGAASAALGRAPRRPAVVRNVIGGAITMGVTYGIGTLIAAAGI